MAWKYPGVDLLCLDDGRSDPAGMLDIGDGGWVVGLDDHRVGELPDNRGERCMKQERNEQRERWEGEE